MNQDLLHRATALCASSEHCCHDIREKLLRWGGSEGEAEEIIDYLLDEKYIDEARFSIAFAKDKMRFNHWGRQKIGQALRMLQIPAPLRSEALQALPEDEYLDILTHILASKQRSVKGKNAYERQAKLIRFALSRGFEMSLIHQCLPEPDEESDFREPDDIDFREPDEDEFHEPDED